MPYYRLLFICSMCLSVWGFPVTAKNLETWKSGYTSRCFRFSENGYTNVDYNEMPA